MEQSRHPQNKNPYKIKLSRLTCFSKRLFSLIILEVSRDLLEIVPFEFQILSKKLVEKTWFLAIMEGNRCVTYSDDGTVLEMFIGLATMEN